MNKASLVLILATILLPIRGLLAQNVDKAQEYINILASDSFRGRGYHGNGDHIAAEYIRNEFRKIGLDSLSAGYFQNFSFPVNTILSCELSLDGEILKAGRDYFVAPGSPDLNLKGDIFPVSEKILSSDRAVRKIRKAIRKGYIPVFLPFSKDNVKAAEHMAKIQKCLKPEAYIFVKETMVWSVSTTQNKIPTIYLLDSAFNKFSRTLMINVNAELIPRYESMNVMAYVKGTTYPDSFIVLCGHYDHLGKMGDAVFNGANDNASGIAMLLDLAAYFAENKQTCSILFIAFAGEEAGLIGSNYYVRHSTEAVPLRQLKFVFNMDLMGTGEDGATVVNGSVFKDHFQRLNAINTKQNYLNPLKTRGKASNSDHYYFSEAGVPSFFIYTMGAYTYYHVPEDHPDRLVLGDAYNRCFLLVRDFVIDLNDLN